MSQAARVHRWDEIALEKVTELLSRKIVTGEKQMLAQVKAAEVAAKTQQAAAEQEQALTAERAGEGHRDSRQETQSRSLGRSPGEGQPQVETSNWAATANKTMSGFPTSYWYDRLLDPVMYLWPVPNYDIPQGLQYYVQKRPQANALQDGTNIFIPYEVFDYFIKVSDAFEATIIPNVIVGQLLAYYLSLARRLDPDKPRNLAKSVTVE